MNAAKKETKLVPVFALWQRKDKNGKDYFTGKIENKDTKIVAFYNNKRNMKDPDINVFTRGGEDGTKLIPYAKMWVNASKAGGKYLSGQIGNDRIVGFFNEKHKASQPYISIYAEAVNIQTVQDEEQEQLPF